MPVSIEHDYNYEPTHYLTVVAGTIVSEAKPWDLADADRGESEEHAEPGETVELIEASRADMDRSGKRAGVDYQITRYRDRKDLDAQIVREGGLVGALEAGIVAAHMPDGDEALRTAWERLESTYKPYADAEDTVNQILNETTR